MWSYLELVFVLHDLRRTIVDPHRSFRKAILLFELRIHQEQRLAKLGWAFLERLLKQITRSLEFTSPLLYCQHLLS
jgi:hypothetical protein